MATQPLPPLAFRAPVALSTQTRSLALASTALALLTCFTAPFPFGLISIVVCVLAVKVSSP